MEVTKSANFNGTSASGVRYSTHWAQVLGPDGQPQDVVVEELLGTPTSYPVEDMAGQSLSGLSGDYHAFITAHQGGKQAARAYFHQHNESYPDPERSEQRRQRMLARIAKLARREA